MAEKIDRMLDAGTLTPGAAMQVLAQACPGFIDVRVTKEIPHAKTQSAQRTLCPDFAGANFEAYTKANNGLAGEGWKKG
ncbi:MAG: hypothetical protein V2A58_12570 [Planctomycetota bacterium]